MYVVRVSRAGYVLANLGKNALAPLVIPLRRDRGCFGMDGDPRMVVDVLDRFAPMMSELQVALHDRTVLELGPGRTPDVCAAAVLAGAARAIGIDVAPQIPADALLGSRYEPLLQRLIDGGSRFLTAVGATAQSAQERHAELSDQPWPLQFQRFDGQTLPLPTGCVDVVLSKSVLEHVRAEQVEPLLADLHRVLAPGGVMIHIVDLRDHMHIVTDEQAEGDWLDALRYPKPLFEAMFSNRSTSINRLRRIEWRTAISRVGFTVEHELLRRFPLPADFRRLALRGSWRGLDEDELSIGFVTFGVRRESNP